ncbi:MAG: RNA polymerase sporulation sigma factor SigH [Solirubrobacteraceae bacterium]
MARLSASPQSQLHVEDGFLVALAKQGQADAMDRIVQRYYRFVRLKASSYFLAGGDADDLIQEGLVGLYKAVRDYRTDRESSFRNFAELCITRQIITAVKTATRNKHTPLNQYVSFSSTPSGGAGESEPTLDEMLPGSSTHDPVNQVISSEELRALVACISTALSELESRVLALYLDGRSYEEVGRRLGCDCKTVDNALQRVKRKVGAHLTERNLPPPSLTPARVPPGVPPARVPATLVPRAHVMAAGCRSAARS